MNIPPYAYCLLKITYNDFLCHKKGELKNSSPLNCRKTINYCNYYAMNLFFATPLFFRNIFAKFSVCPRKRLTRIQKGVLCESVCLHRKVLIGIFNGLLDLLSYTYLHTYTDVNFCRLK